MFMKFFGKQMRSHPNPVFIFLLKVLDMEDYESLGEVVTDLFINQYLSLA